MTPPAPEPVRRVGDIDAVDLLGPGGGRVWTSDGFVRFDASDWTAPAPPRPGMRVRFQLDGARARDVRPVGYAPELDPEPEAAP